MHEMQRTPAVSCEAKVMIGTLARQRRGVASWRTQSLPLKTPRLLIATLDDHLKVLLTAHPAACLTFSAVLGLSKSSQLFHLVFVNRFASL